MRPCSETVTNKSSSSTSGSQIEVSMDDSDPVVVENDAKAMTPSSPSSTSDSTTSESESDPRHCHGCGKKKRKYDKEFGSKHSLHWEEFFGSSVDLAPTLLSIYDKFATAEPTTNNGPLDQGGDSRSNLNHVHVTNQNDVIMPSSSSSSACSMNDNDKVTMLSTSSSAALQESVNDNENKVSNSKSNLLINENNNNKLVKVMIVDAQNGEITEQTDDAMSESSDKRPLSISSMSSASSSSLPSQYRYKRPITSDYETGSSEVESIDRSGSSLAPDSSTSNVSIETLSAEEELNDKCIHSENKHIFEAVSPKLSSGSNISESPMDERKPAMCLSSASPFRSPHVEIIDAYAEVEIDSSFGPTYFPSHVLSSSSPSPIFTSTSRVLLSPTPKSQTAKSVHRASSTPGHHGQTVLSKTNIYESYAHRVAAEVIETERIYVKSLNEIIQGYLNPLRSQSHLGITEDQIKYLFGNLIDIHKFNSGFLCELESCGEDPVKMAQCFVDKNEGFTIYTEYCTNYPKSVEVLTLFMSQLRIAEYFKDRQTALDHGLPAGAYLLKPVQRILKYHLLLQNIVKNFEKTQSGYEVLVKALNHMTSMAQHINEMKRKHEHSVRIQELQGQLEEYDGPDLTTLGDLIIEGSFRVYGAKASRQVFLFEKAILITKKQEDAMLSCKEFIMCSNLMLVESIPKEPQSFHVIPFDNPRMQCTLQAKTVDVKRRWCQELKRLILDSYKGRIPEKAKSLVLEQLGKSKEEDGTIESTEQGRLARHHLAAPEYLDRRRARRKSGTKIDFGLLKNKKGNRKQQDGSNLKGSPMNGDGPKHYAILGQLASRTMQDMTAYQKPQLSRLSSKSLDDISMLNVYTTANGTAAVRTSPVARLNHRHATSAGSSPNKLSVTPLSRYSLSQSQSADRLRSKSSSSCTKRAESFKRAIQSHHINSLNRSDNDDSDSSNDENGFCPIKTSPGNSEYVPSSKMNHAKITSPQHGYDGDDETVHVPTSVGSMPSLNEVSTSRPSSSNGHRPLQRMDYSKSPDTIAKSNSVNVQEAMNTNNLFYQNVSFRELSPNPLEQQQQLASRSSSNASSYDNLQRRRTQSPISFQSQSSREPSPATLISPANLHSHTDSYHDQSSVSGPNSRPTSWSSSNSDKRRSSELSYIQEDPWVLNPDSPTHGERDKPKVHVSCFGQNSELQSPLFYKNRLLDIGRSNSFPSSATLPHSDNLDWFVYTNKIASSIPKGLDDTGISSRTASFSNHNSSPNKFSPKVTRSLSHDWQNKTVMKYGTPPRNAFTSKSMSEYSNSPEKQSIPESMYQRKGSLPENVNLLSQIKSLIWSNSISKTNSSKSKLDKANCRPNTCYAGSADETERIVEEMKAYAQQSRNQSAMAKFPQTLPTTCVDKTAKQLSSFDINTPNIACLQQHVRRSSKSSLSSGSSNSSGNISVTALGPGILATTAQQGNDGLVGTLRTKLQSLTAKLATRKTNSNPCAFNDISPPVYSRSMSEGHTPSVFYVPSQKSRETPKVRGFVNNLARQYSWRAREVTQPSYEFSKGHTPEPDTNTLMKNVEQVNTSLNTCVENMITDSAPNSSLPLTLSSSRLCEQAIITDSGVPETLSEIAEETLPNLVKQSDHQDDKAIVTIQQSDSPISVGSYFEKSSNQEIDSRSLPSHHRRNSHSSESSNESFYERKLSRQLDDDGVFHDGNICSDNQSAQQAITPRVSIKDYVHFLEENLKSPEPTKLDYPRRQPARGIQEKVQTLKQSTKYQRPSQVLGDELRRELTPVRDIKAALFSNLRSMDSKFKSELCIADSRERHHSMPTWPSACQIRNAHSLGRLDQMCHDTESLVTMRGWVKQLVTRFQTDNL